MALCTAARHKVLNLDDYVFTTEAHPLLRAKKTEPSNRFQRFLGKWAVATEPSHGCKLKNNVKIDDMMSHDERPPSLDVGKFHHGECDLRWFLWVINFCVYIIYICIYYIHMYLLSSLSALLILLLLLILSMQVVLFALLLYLHDVITCIHVCIYFPVTYIYIYACVCVWHSVMSYVWTANSLRNSLNLVCLMTLKRSQGNL